MKNVIIISGSPRVGGNTPMPWPADQKGPETGGQTPPREK